MVNKPEYRKFISEQELVENYTKQNKTISPWIVFTPYVIREGVPGYMVSCKPDDPDAELWNKDEDHV